MTDETPEWALAEVDKRIPIPNLHNLSIPEIAQHIDRQRRLAASLIAKHEKEPIDPLLIETREIAAKFFEENSNPIASENSRAGKLDSTPLARVAAEALRRGIELGKAGAA